MEEQRIKLETAKLAKELGFKERTKYLYLNDENGYMYLDERDWYLSDHWEDEYLAYDKVFPAPTQTILQKWLREKHNFDVCLHPLITSNIDNKKYGVYYIKWYNHPPHPQFLVIGDRVGSLKKFNSPEEAIEEGLVEVLNLI